MACFIAVTDPRIWIAETAQSTAYQVRAPRVSDAVGRALRDVYSGETKMPEDFAEILRRLH